MASTDWEQYKDEIEQLYVRENKSLRQVQDSMAEKGFHKTWMFRSIIESQYETQFAKWNLREDKEPGATDLESFARRVEKRKQIGETSEVFANGEQYPPEKLRKVLSEPIFGDGLNSTAETFSGPGGEFLFENMVVEGEEEADEAAPSPNTPEGIIVRTPKPPKASATLEGPSKSLPSVWSPSLPWARFYNLLQSRLDRDQAPLHFTVTLPSLHATGILSGGVMKNLSSIIPWSELTRSSNIDTISRAAAALKIIMPEEYSGQHHSLATRLCELKPTSMDPLNLELFLWSNNFDTPDEYTEVRDTRMMETFAVSSWNSVKNLKILLSMQDPTVESIVERLFACAVRVRNLDNLEMMLKAGMHPDHGFEPTNRLRLEFRAGQRPLERAACTPDDSGLQLTQLLLDFGADIECGALQCAIERSNIDTIRTLLGRGATVHTHHLDKSAHEIENMDLFNELLSRCTDVNDLIPIWLRGRWYYTTILGSSACSSRPEIVKLLLETGTVLNPDVTCTKRYVHPLVSAVRYGTPQLIKLLLQAGVDITTVDYFRGQTLLESAAKSNTTERQYLAGGELPLAAIVAGESELQRM
ncbi:ankyrin repeat-containing domain protein [Aspergillus varians]